MKSNIKLLKTYNQFHLAKLDEASLLNDDIQVILRDGNTVSIAPYYSVTIGGIKLYVFEEDFERAAKILNPHLTVNQFNSAEEGHESILCPKCASTTTFQHHSILSGILFLVVSFVPFSIPKKKYQCLSCEHVWRKYE